MKATIALPIQRIEEICRQHDVVELAVFGSVLSEDFGAESDVDFLVRFRNDDAGPWGEMLTALKVELSSELGRPVDVVTRASIEQSRNWILRRSILDNAEFVYGP